MPASPRRWRTCPRPPERQVASAVSRTPSSARRPTKGAARSAPAAGPSRRQQRTVPSNPLAGSAPRGAHSIRPTSVARTASETRISPGPAASVRRAARFTDSPVTVYSRCASLPVPLATTWPPARPMCMCRGRPIPAARGGTASRMARAARAARSASLPWDTGAPKTAMTQSPMCLSTRPPCSCTIRSARPKKRSSSACVSSAPSSRLSAVKPARSAKRTATCRRSPSLPGSDAVARSPGVVAMPAPAPPRRAAMARRIFFRCPSGATPRASRSASAKSGSTSASTAFSRKAGAYPPSPSPRSHAATSTRLSLPRFQAPLFLTIGARTPPPGRRGRAGECRPGT